MKKFLKTNSITSIIMFITAALYFTYMGFLLWQSIESLNSYAEQMGSSVPTGEAVNFILSTVALPLFAILTMFGLGVITRHLGGEYKPVEVVATDVTKLNAKPELKENTSAAKKTAADKESPIKKASLPKENAGSKAKANKTEDKAKAPQNKTKKQTGNNTKSSKKIV